MLAFSSFCDAHFHIFQCSSYENAVNSVKSLPFYLGTTSAHSKKEFQSQEDLCNLIEDENHILCRTFGLHPQMPLLENACFLENLLKENKIDAIGEAGFDLFTQEFKDNIEVQKKAWDLQLNLAVQFQKPLVIHCRKALNLLFADIKNLSLLPGVLFHSFCGGFTEAQSLLKKLPQAYFSFGKQILNGNKKSISCVKNLPAKNLLLETDSPFQTLKGEKFTSLIEIKRVYESCYLLRDEKISEQEFSARFTENFLSLYKK